MWYDSELNSTTANAQLINGNKGFGYALSIEAGKQTNLNNNWSLTPQAQFVWSSVKFDTFNDAWGASVSSRRGGSLKTRLGISADYRNAWQDEYGMTARSHIYGILNLHQEYISKSKVTVADLELDNKTDTTWGSVGFGGSYVWADEKYGLYGEGSLSTSFNNFSESYTMKGSIGFKVKW